jgi:hypothetical protein
MYQYYVDIAKATRYHLPVPLIIRPAAPSGSGYPYRIISLSFISGGMKLFKGKTATMIPTSIYTPSHSTVIKKMH